MVYLGGGLSRARCRKQVFAQCPHCDEPIEADFRGMDLSSRVF